MKVCLVNSFYPPYIGGAETYVSNLAQGLVKMGHDVTVYCSDRPLSPGRSTQEGVGVVRMSTPLMLYGTPLPMLPPEFLNERYDVIHANFPGPYLAAISAFSCVLKGTPAVLTWHNDLPPLTAGAGALVVAHGLVAPLYLGLFDRIIATTATYARSSPLLRAHSNVVRVIHNGVDTRRFNPNVSGEDVRERYGLQGKIVVLFVGALTPWHGYKGLDILINALREVRRKRSEVVLLVVGEGEMKRRYMRLAGDLGLDGSVFFAGYVDDANLPLYYAACDIAVLASKDISEGFGLVLLEAMAAGKAVIGSKVGGVVDVIREGENGIMSKPNDVMSLAEAMGTLCEDEEMRRRMGLNGRRFAELHDWSKVTAIVEALYKEIV
jgi:glycosyltransferase involved in cell wall biosynthesis